MEEAIKNFNKENSLLWIVLVLSFNGTLNKPKKTFIFSESVVRPFKKWLFLFNYNDILIFNKQTYSKSSKSQRTFVDFVCM